MSRMQTGNRQFAHHPVHQHVRFYIRDSTLSSPPKKNGHCWHHPTAHFTSELWLISGSETYTCDSADALDQMDPAASDDQIAKLIETQRLMTRDGHSPRDEQRFTTYEYHDPSGRVAD